MAHFPTLEDAATLLPRAGKEKEELHLMDDLMEALWQLKISEWCLRAQLLLVIAKYNLPGRPGRAG